jgi:EmrB/QacA subfamily drug resistance transporter
MIPGPATEPTPAMAGRPTPATASRPTPSGGGDGSASGRQGRPGWTLAAMCVGLFMVMLDTTITGNSMPVIQRDLSLSITQLQWVNNGYTLVIGSIVVLCGRLGDIFGRRRFFMVGVVGFVAGSALSGAAQSSWWLIGARALQGGGAAFLAALSLSILTHAYPAESRGRAIGIWAGVSGVALSIGPLLGGFLTQDASWRYIFYINVPISVLAIVLVLVGVAESRDTTVAPEVDRPGAGLMIGGLFLVILAIMQGREWGWLSPSTLAVLLGGLVLLGLFGWYETRVKVPLLDPSVFRNGRLTATNSVAVLMSFGMMGALFFMPLYLQNVLGYSPTVSGLALLPLTALLTASAPLAGRITDARGPRLPMGVGLALAAIGLGLLTAVSTTSGYGTLVVPFVLMGLGFGLTLSPMSTAAMAVAEPEQVGAVAGLLNMSRQVGGTLGVAVLGAVFSSEAGHKATNLLVTHGFGASSSRVQGLVGFTSSPSTFAREAARFSPSLAHDIRRAITIIFVSAFSSAMAVSCGIMALAAVVAIVCLRARKSRPLPDPAAKIRLSR